MVKYRVPEIQKPSENFGVMPSDFVVIHPRNLTYKCRRGPAILLLYGSARPGGHRHTRHGTAAYQARPNTGTKAGDHNVKASQFANICGRKALSLTQTCPGCRAGVVLVPSVDLFFLIRRYAGDRVEFFGDGDYRGGAVKRQDHAA